MEINHNDVWCRHGDLKQVKVSSVQPTQIGWKYRNDKEEYFTERNVFRISHSFVASMAGMEIKRRTRWQLKTNYRVTVLVLEIIDDVVEYTHDRGVCRLSKTDFLSAYEAQQ